MKIWFPVSAPSVFDKFLGTRLYRVTLLDLRNLIPTGYSVFATSYCHSCIHFGPAQYGVDKQYVLGSNPSMNKTVINAFHAFPNGFFHARIRTQDLQFVQKSHYQLRHMNITLCIQVFHKNKMNWAVAKWDTNIDTNGASRGGLEKQEWTSREENWQSELDGLQKNVLKKWLAIPNFLCGKLGLLLWHHR